MEKIVTIETVGTYAEREYKKQDGTTDKFRSRGFVMRQGGDIFYGEMMGDLALKNRDTQYKSQQLYVVRGNWRHRTWGEGNDRHENNFYITDLQTF